MAVINRYHSGGFYQTIQLFYCKKSKVCWSKLPNKKSLSKFILIYKKSNIHFNLLITVQIWICFCLQTNDGKE